MPLPNDFSQAEHLQDTLRKTMNKQVRAFFSDVGDEAWEPDISTPRASLRTACTHQEADTIDMTVLRALTFYLVVGQLRHTIDVVPTPEVSNYQVLRRQKPIISLYFFEDYQDTEGGYDPVRGIISFRLMNHTSTNLSESEARGYGQKIKTLFGPSHGLIWRKGRYMASYSDWDKGYQLQLLVRDKAEGKRLVEKVLEINSHNPDWENFEFKENEAPAEAFPIVPPTETILGKRVRLPRRRPVAAVRFHYAKLRVAGVAREVCLYDRIHKFPEALVKD